MKSLVSGSEAAALLTKGVDSEKAILNSPSPTEPVPRISHDETIRAHRQRRPVPTARAAALIFLLFILFLLIYFELRHCSSTNI
jgi:hypothetical protein